MHWPVEIAAISGHSSVSSTQSRCWYTWIMPEPWFVVSIFGPPNDERHCHDEKKNGTSIIDGDIDSVRLVQ